jgi:RNA polymerase sigma factor (sigma-70 family)
VEKELLERIKNKDKKAFEELYNIYSEYALRVALAVTKDKSNAADTVQETFIRVYKYIDSYDLDKPFKTWFYNILINECNRILSKSPKVILIDDFTSTNYEKGNDTDNKHEDLYSAIENLEDINRIPIVLMYLEGFSEVEISNIMGVNINTIKSRLYKGRQKLKKLLESIKRGE